jgi:hypothetical protein
MRNYRNSKELVKFGKNAQKSTKVRPLRNFDGFLTKSDYNEHTGRMSYELKYNINL